MATTRVTISLPADLAAKLKDQAGDRSVSAFVADLIHDHLEDAELTTLWSEYLEDVGVSESDIANADAVIDQLLSGKATHAA